MDDAGGRLLWRALNCTAGFCLADVLEFLPDSAALAETWPDEPRLTKVAIGTLEFAAVEQVCYFSCCY